MNTLEQFSGEYNGVLPSLDPPAGWDATPALNDRAGEYLLKGRQEARRRGRVAVLEALAGAADTSTRSDRPGAIVATHWPGGTGTTTGGRDGRLGQGVVFRGSLAEHAAQLETWAAWDPNEVHAALIARLRAKGISPDELRNEIKRASPARAMGLSLFGGRAEYEFDGRFALFMDNDGEGPPDALRDALASVHLSYLFQARPGSDRWHMEVPFSEPIRLNGLVYPLHRPPPPEVRDDTVSRWIGETFGTVGVAIEYDAFGEVHSRDVRVFSGDEKSAFEAYKRRLQEWKHSFYTPAMAWLLGIFSEIGGLACRWIVNGAQGANGRPLPHRDLTNAPAMPGDRLSVSHLGLDAMPAHQLLGLGYPYTRRAATDPVPITQYRDGHMLSVLRVLELTGFVPPASVNGGKVPHGSRLHVPSRERQRVQRATADFFGVGSAESDSDVFQDASRGDSDLREDRTMGVLRPAADDRDTLARPGLYAAIVDGFRVANLVRRKLVDKTVVTCPHAGGHSHGDGSGTVIMGNGSVKCHHGSCAGRAQADFLVALPIDAQIAIVAAVPGVLPDDFDALHLPSVVKVAARVRLLRPAAFEQTLKRLYGEDVVPRLGEQNRVARWYVRVCAEKVM